MSVFIESSLTPSVLQKRTAEIIILEEGPGNKGRKCWYGGGALESGRDVFRGAQVYANHPSKTQQTDLPERDVRELIGRIKETWVGKNPKNGKKCLYGKLKIFEGEQYDWALSLISESIQAQKEGFPPVAQVSIHADGDIEKRIIENDEYNYVKKIKSAVSVDMVTKGGVKNAGFTKFVESITGGNSMTTNEQRLEMIKRKMLEALNGEDRAFLDKIEESEAAEEGNLSEGAEAEEYEQVFADENGNLYNEAGEAVDPEEVIMVDRNGNEVDPEAVLAAAEEEAEVEEPGQDDEEYADFADDDEETEYDEPQRGHAMHASGRGDEVPISELATRFPHLANEIDREEIGFEESARDVDVVNLKFENKLLKSRLIAERKIQESELPAGFISIDELVGKNPEDMDRLLESRAALFTNVINIVESSRPAPAAAPAEVRDVKAGTGQRLLSASIMPM